MSFGKKGLQAGVAAPAPGGFGRAGKSAEAAHSFSDEGNPLEGDMSARREAFIAAERARAAGLSESGQPLAETASEPAQLLSSTPLPARPRQSGPELAGPNINASAPSASRPAPKIARDLTDSYEHLRHSVGDRGQRKSSIFGDPEKRSLGLAYVLWFFAGQFAVHRFYCGHKESALFQLGLLWGGFVVMAIFPPMGILAFVLWVGWIVGDLFLMPSMMRRFKADSKYDGSAEIFA